ncbi:MAG: DUF3301 domain-containing protein [Gammaproteobacteria bacterium]
MFSLEYLIWLLIAGILLVYFWHSGRFTGKARAIAIDYCKQFDLQLLDHSVVIKGVWPERAEAGNLTLRRRYQFEFSSTGTQRYQGVLVLLGTNLKSIELEAYELPEQDQASE